MRSTVAVLTTTAVTGGSGFAYWTVGARLYPAAEVGQATALVAALSVVALVAGQSLVVTLLGRLPRALDDRQRAGMLVAALATAGVAALLACVVAIALLPTLAPDLDALRRLDGAALFGLAALSQTFGLVLDGAAIALRRGSLMTVRNAGFGLGKLGLLALASLPAVSPSMGGGVRVLLGSWAVVGAVSVILGARRLHILVARAWPRREDLRSGWTMVRQGAGVQVVAALAGALPPQLLPVLVAARLGAAEAGWFGLTWLLGSLCFTVSPAVSAALLAEGAHDPGQLARRTRTAAALIAVMLVPPVAAFIGAGRLLLGVFGPDYALYGGGLLVLLAASAVPDAITNLTVSVLRVRERLTAAAALNSIIALVAVCGTWLALPRYGIAAAGWAWMAAQSAATLAAAGGAFVPRPAGTLRPVPVTVD